MANESVTKTRNPDIDDLLVTVNQIRNTASTEELERISSAAHNVHDNLMYGVRAIGELMWHAGIATDTTGPINGAVIADLGTFLRTIADTQRIVADVMSEADFLNHGGPEAEKFRQALKKPN